MVSQRDRNALLFLTAILVLVVGVRFDLFNLQTITQSDFGILDDFNDGVDGSAWDIQNVLEEEGTVKLQAMGEISGRIGLDTDADAFIKNKADLTGNDLRFVLESDYRLSNIARNTPCKSPKITITVGTCEFRPVLGTGQLPNDILVETFVGLIQRDQGELWIDGVKNCEFNPLEDYNVEVRVEKLEKVSCGGRSIIDEIRFRKPFTTQLDPDTEAIYQKTFTGERTVTLDDFTVPVKSFSLANPVVIISSVETGVDSTAEPLAIWSKGGSVDIPLGEVWQVLYIGDKKFTQGKECIKGFDTDTNDCVTQITFVQECSEDQILDPLSGDCINTLRFACERSGGIFVGNECRIGNEVVEKPLDILLIGAGVLIVLIGFLLIRRR